MHTYTILNASTETHYDTGKALFQEYAASLNFKLCFQGFEAELASMKTQYAAPAGALLLAENTAGEPVGCVAVRQWKDATAELKRMYLRKEARGQGLAQRLLDTALETARHLGYQTIRLDTMPDMQVAIALYRKNGFYDIAPYRENPDSGAVYLEKKL